MWLCFVQLVCFGREHAPGDTRPPDDETRTRVIETVRPSFEPYVRGTDVHFTAACWLTTARA